ncbi:MAG: efflux RND transporter periplasmic adaptor subunit [Planctomycetes bacterium]|nr:efflux RND transporter periplasmic adaptor subunit [Planctomycetota bacterium]
MATSPDSDAPATTAPTPVHGGRRRFLSFVPTALVFLLLGAVAVWGFRTEWKFGNPFRTRASAKAQEDDVQREPEVTPGPPAPPGGCALNGTRIRLASAGVAERMGLRIELAESRSLAAAVTAPAELRYDETRLARLSSRVPGTVVRVGKQVGEEVRKGEVLALIDAVAVGKAKADLLEALAQLDLAEKQAASSEEAAKKGAVSGIQAERDAAAARQAKTRVLAAQQALGNLGLAVDAEELRKLTLARQSERLRQIGLTPDYVRAIGPVTSGNLIPVVAPLDGRLVERDVVAGEVIDPAKVLFLVADVSRIWVMADVRNEDADRVAVGQRLTFTADGHPGESLVGAVAWTSTAIDPRTRTLRIRAEVANPAAHWRARTFGTARVTLRADERPTTVVSPDSVQREGDCRYVFVRLDETTFEARAVRLGVRGEVAGPDGRKKPRVEVLDGVRPGERVVTTGSFVLKAELLKDRFGGAD